MTAMNNLPEPPYPSDTLYKGWRFELDLQRVMQSDTWALASPVEQAWLLKLWAVAWQQHPCGTLPSDDRLIAARLGMPLADFLASKEVLTRGWWLANDGRLYHGVLTERVLDMVARKNGERERKAAYRERKEAEKQKDVPLPSGGVPDLSHGTDMGQTRPSLCRDATGTGTGTGTSLKPSVPNGTDADASPSGMTTKEELWTAGRSMLLEAGVPKGQCGSFVGKLVTDYGDAVVIEAVRAAVLATPADPREYLKATCQRLHGERKSGGAQKSRHDLRGKDYTQRPDGLPL